MATANIAAASGYEALSATRLGEGVVYAGQIRDRNWEESIIPYITNTQIMQDLLKCGQLIEFRKPARVGNWRPYEKNQELISDQVSPDNFCLSICGSAYKSLKFDKTDIYQACNEWDAFEAQFLSDAWNQLDDLWQRYVLTSMSLQASVRNSGKNAGLYANVDLGTIGAPFELTPNNLLSFLGKLSQIMGDVGRWYDGEMFLIVPRSFNTLLAETVLNRTVGCCDVNNSVLIKGLKTPDLQGFAVYETDRVRPTLDPATGKLVYPILFGWQDAFGFAGDIIEADINKVPRSFGVTYDMLSIYGGGVIYPEALGKAYVTLSTDGVANTNIW